MAISYVCDHNPISSICSSAANVAWKGLKGTGKGVVVAIAIKILFPGLSEPCLFALSLYMPVAFIVVVTCGTIGVVSGLVLEILKHSSKISQYLE